MNFLSYLLGISLIVLLSMQSVNLHLVTVCRQEAWLLSTVLITRNLLSKRGPNDIFDLQKCSITGFNHGYKVIWGSWSSMKKNHFDLHLTGKL